jgi:hypothetical protein
MRPPTRPVARSTGGCFGPRAGTPIQRGAAPRTCRRWCAIDPTGSWCWTCWTSLAAGGWSRRWWWPMPAMGLGRAGPRAGGARAGLGGPGQGHHQRLSGGGGPAGRPVPRAGGRPRPRYRTKRSSLAELVTAAGPAAVKTVAWPEGTRGKLRSRFVALGVGPAGVKLRRAVAGGELPVRWLLAEWPPTSPSRSSTGWPACPRTPRFRSWSGWPSCAGASSTTTASSKTALVLTTSRAPASVVGTTT